MDFSNGKVMLFMCGIIAVLILIIVGVCTCFFRKPKWSLLIPTCICLVIMIPFFIIMIIPGNGIGGFTSLDSFGVFIYALSTFMFTGIGEIIILVVRKIISR